MRIYRAILIVVALASATSVFAQKDVPPLKPVPKAVPISLAAPLPDLLAQVDDAPPVRAAKDDNAGTTESDTPNAKLPVPDEAAQSEATSLIKDVYKADYDNAKTTVQKRELAIKLLQEGKQTEGDPAGRFVLLRIARDIASQTGDVSVTIQAIDQIAKTYDVDPFESKVEVLTKMSKATSTPPAQKELVEAIEHVMDVAVDLDNYQFAQQLAEVAITVSRNSKDASLQKRAVSRSKACNENAAAFATAQKALKVLDENPTDPDANLVVGKYRCFNRMDWEHGLPLLALGSDAELKNLADRESTSPREARDQAALGDGWWAISEKETGVAKTSVQSRAGHWYQLALPGLAGLSKAKVAKRLSEIKPSSTTQKSDSVKKAMQETAIETTKARAKKPSEPYPLAVYRHMVPGRNAFNVTLMSNGQIGTGTATWRLNGNMLALDWPNGNDAPWHDELRLSDDGLSYYGKNRSGAEIRGDAVERSKEWKKMLGIER